MASHKREGRFGTEVRLIGEMLTTAEKVGAGRDFFASLAHDERLFWRILELSPARPVFSVWVNYELATSVIVNLYSKIMPWLPGPKKDGAVELNDFTTDITDELTKKASRFEVAITLFWFDNKISSEKVIEIMKEEVYRPATAVELSILMKAFPGAQKKIPIVGLGTVINPDGASAHVPYLDYTDDGPEMIFNLIDKETEWDPFIRFAAVRE